MPLDCEHAIQRINHADGGKMIELDVRSYCQDCLQFKPYADRNDIYDGTVICYTNTVVKCVDADRCEAIYEKARKDLQND